MMKKNRYDDIHIPDQLADVIHHAQQKAVQRKKSFRLIRYSSLVAACVAFLWIINIPGVASAMSKIPVLGSIVQVLQFGEGGEITDGAKVETTVIENSLQIQFSHQGESLDRAPFYTVQQKNAPNRLIFTFNGVRDFDYDTVKNNLLTLPLVKDVYPNIILDDSAMRFVVELEDGVHYSITELKNPASIQLTLNSSATSTIPQKIFALRTKAMPLGESMGTLEEIYPKEDISFVKSTGNTFVGVIGEYATLQEAEDHLKHIKAQYADANDFYIDSWMSNKNPQ